MVEINDKQNSGDGNGKLMNRVLNRDLKTAFLDMVQRIDRAIPKLGLMSNGPHFAPLMERSMKKPDVCENCA